MPTFFIYADILSFYKINNFLIDFFANGLTNKLFLPTVVIHFHSAVNAFVSGVVGIFVNLHCVLNVVVQRKRAVETSAVASHTLKEICRSFVELEL